ncbi:DUF6415 family natural product biosynthesis protein [Streptomyces luteocolor]|uniref:DUF6415 family natural product biosynthesis protein n=1 Tax=Streptomyces luteocolor TaxID=285500 RepID=UPI00114D197B|nr:DUF6415 family natural product biosynthesis protein [Streptomyces luteocolor]
MDVQDVPPVRALIDEACAASRDLPTPQRLVELDGLLRTQLGRLAPIVQRQADGLNRGTRDWWNRQRAVDATRNALREPCCDGSALLPAAMLVAELGRRLHELDGYVRDE